MGQKNNAIRKVGLVVFGILFFIGVQALIVLVASFFINNDPTTSLSLKKEEYPELYAEIVDITENLKLERYQEIDDYVNYQFKPDQDYIVVDSDAWKSSDSISVGYGKNLKKRIVDAQIVVIKTKYRDYTQTYFKSTGAKAHEITTDSERLVFIDRSSHNILLVDWIEPEDNTITADSADFVVTSKMILKRINSHFGK